MTQEQLATLECVARIDGPASCETGYMEKAAALRSAMDELGIILCRLLRGQHPTQYDVKDSARHAACTTACYLIALQKIVLMCDIGDLDVTNNIETILRAEIAALQRKAKHKEWEEHFYE